MAVAVLATAVPAGSKSALKKTTRLDDQGPSAATAPPTATKKTRFFDEVLVAAEGSGSLATQPPALSVPQVEVPAPTTATKRKM